MVPQVSLSRKPEAATAGVLLKKVFLKILHRKTPVPESLS